MDSLLLLLFFPNVVNAEPVTYEKVKPLFEVHCSACHNPSWPEKNWLDYDVAKANAEKIKQRTWVTRQMPPISSTITEKQRAMIRDWVDQGAKK